MYFWPLKFLDSLNLPESILLKCFKIYTDEMINLHLGQALDIAWHSNILNITQPPTIENYLRMCANKTGGLARLGTKICAEIAGASLILVQKISNFAESLGVAFQIQDDLMNIIENQLAVGKGSLKTQKELTFQVELEKIFTKEKEPSW